VTRPTGLSILHGARDDRHGTRGRSVCAHVLVTCPGVAPHSVLLPPNSTVAKFDMGALYLQAVQAANALRSDRRDSPGLLRSDDEAIRLAAFKEGFDRLPGKAPVVPRLLLLAAGQMLCQNRSNII
jgi:hypothetical protein